jgi:hypothetical protein
MTQNAVDFMRKYADIINEAQQPQHLNEGFLDTLKQYVPKIAKALDPATLKQIATTVKQATGGDYSLTKDNVQRVAKALGAPEGQEQVSEGISPTLGGKIAQALHLVAIGAAIPLASVTGGISFVIGVFALMFTDAFWGNQAGQLGSEYDMVGDPVSHAAIVPKKGVTPKKPVSSAGGFGGGASNAEF